jgi:hypothetical protein
MRELCSNPPTDVVLFVKKVVYSLKWLCSGPKNTRLCALETKNLRPLRDIVRHGDKNTHLQTFARTREAICVVGR